MYSGSLLIQFHFFPCVISGGYFYSLDQTVSGMMYIFLPHTHTHCTMTCKIMYYIARAWVTHLVWIWYIPTQYVQLCTDSMSVWTVKTCTSLQYRVAWNEVTNIHPQRRLMPCRSDIMDIVSQNHSTQCTCSYLHGPVCVVSFSLARCM